jgi:hypothetical protein
VKKRLLNNALAHTEGGADKHGRWEASKIMRKLGSFLVFGVALISGCGGKHYVRGHGDVGQFIFQHAIAYGGRPVATNGLPSIGGDGSLFRMNMASAFCFRLRSFSVSRILCAPHLGRRRIQQVGQPGISE